MREDIIADNMPKSVPHDQKSEQALLAALMLEPKIYKQIDLSVDDFYENRHQRIYEIITEICEEGMQPDYVTVNAKIISHGWQEQIGERYPYTLCDEIPAAITQGWKNYVSIIKKKSAARKLIELARQIDKFAQNGLNGLEGKIESTIGQLIEIKAKAEGKKKGITELVREWVMTSSGNIMTSDVHKELGLTSRDLKKQANEALRRMEQENVVVKCGDKNGCYRLLEKDAPLIDFLNVNLNDPYPIKWPFRLEELVDIYPGNVIVVAGAANAGKTAFLLNCIRLNMNRLKIEYFSSEMGPEELHLRLKKFGDIALNEWKFAARQRSSKFADVIVPDSLNIIDYLEINKDPWEVGSDIKDIFDRLNKGIAIIAIQKKSGTDVGRGGEFTLEKPRLYLAMEKGVLKIVKGKNWSNPEINPNGMDWQFKLVQGCKFIETGGSAWNLS